MKRRLSKYSLILVGATLLLQGSNLYAINTPVLNTSPQIIQWVKITSNLLNDTIGYNINAYDLESSFIDCGDRCHLVKLTTTPLSNEGKLVIRLKYKNCGSSTSVEIPFNTQDDKLVTSIKTYNLEIGSEYCHWEYPKAVVSGDLGSNRGYSIELVS